MRHQARLVNPHAAAKVRLSILWGVAPEDIGDWRVDAPWFKNYGVWASHKGNDVDVPVEEVLLWQP